MAHKLAGLVLADDGGAGLSRVSLPAPMQHHQKEHSDGDLVRKRVRLLASERSSPSPSPCPSPPSLALAQKQDTAADASARHGRLGEGPARGGGDGGGSGGRPGRGRGAAGADGHPAAAVEPLAQEPARVQVAPQASGHRRRWPARPPPPETPTAATASSIPVRAALTWHEDEITIYDPDDEDDDGTGINGIGFKPTPAIAYARRLKQKQQLAEYKKREAIDARGPPQPEEEGQGRQPANQAPEGAGLGPEGALHGG